MIFLNTTNKLKHAHKIDWKYKPWWYTPAQIGTTLTLKMQCKSIAKWQILLDKLILCFLEYKEFCQWGHNIPIYFLKSNGKPTQHWQQMKKTNSIIYLAYKVYGNLDLIINKTLPPTKKIYVSGSLAFLYWCSTSLLTMYSVYGDLDHWPLTSKIRISPLP